MVQSTLENSRGDYTIRLAKTDQELKELMQLRYDVYYKEKGAKASGQKPEYEEDVDQYDAYATHIIVTHKEEDGSEQIIATHRLIFQEDVPEGGKFYTEQEFDCTPLFSDGKKLMEIGRVCIHKDFRTGHVLSMMWKFTMALIVEQGVERMFGCGSFIGGNPEDHKHTLSHLYYTHLAPPSLRPIAKNPSCKLKMLPQKEVDEEKAMSGVPPLMRGYLRLRGMVSDTAFIDEQFNMIDTCIFVDTDLIPKAAVLNRITKQR